MPQVIVERDGVRVEGDLSFEFIRELMGLSTPNGHVSTASQPVNGHSKAGTSAVPSSIPTLSAQESLNLFMREISDNGRTFISLLKESPMGIEANALAQKMGYTTPSQIGGLVGGGLAKIGKRLGVKMDKVYIKKIMNMEGKRTVMFYPGKMISNEKPAG